MLRCSDTFGINFYHGCGIYKIAFPGDYVKTLITIFFVIFLNPFPAHGDQSSDQVGGAPNKIHLKVANIGLHQSHAPCKPHEKTYDALPSTTPARIMLECVIDRDSEQINIAFSSDGKNIVRVTRTQYLKSGDPQSVEVMKAAVKFYGQPNQFDEANLLANYGSAYSVSYSNRVPIITRNKSGAGLLITGYPCGDGTFGTEDCRGKGARFIRYDLVDAHALEISYKDGEAKFSKQVNDKLKMQKF